MVGRGALMPGKRVRLAPEEAQTRILDAAERRLAIGGPEALRLVDIAKDLGISHPAIQARGFVCMTQIRWYLIFV